MYLSNLKHTLNLRTDKSYYYVHICGVWSRVSKTEYLQREGEATRQDSFLTKIKGDLQHNTKTIYFPK